MADQGRKGFGQKMEESLTPQSQKTYAEQGKEALTDGYDKLQAEITPESQKSAHQSAYDSVKGNADDQNKSMLESAKEKLGL
ncbi:heat shock protein 9/12-domain-containing protein [Umbelopsis sp. AD052]|nr:heat shock protein 9/12-domain-containing protein [Umbelopsis sp. AD052]